MRADRTMAERELVPYLALVTASVALAIDMVLPAFAEMRPAFGLEPDATDLSLTITLFFLGSGLGTFVAGPLTDAFGRKSVLWGGMALYGVAAVVSALASSLAMLYIARFAWGLASAGPRTVAQAITRDRYEGDQMARIMTLVQAVFFIAPVSAPLIGEAMVQLGGWPWVFGFGAFNAAVVILWTFRLEETLLPERRRPFTLAGTRSGFRHVVANRVTWGMALSITATYGAFFSFLSSTELVFEEMLDRPDWFVPYFSIGAVIYGVVAFAMGFVLRRVTGASVAWGAGIALVLTSAVFLVVALATDGTPGPWALMIPLTAANCAHISFFPTANALALDPMGEMAGTAAAVISATSAIGGSILAALISSQIDTTVTPMALGYLVLAVVALALQWWARGGRSAVPAAG